MQFCASKTGDIPANITHFYLQNNANLLNNLQAPFLWGLMSNSTAVLWVCLVIIVPPLSISRTLHCSEGRLYFVYQTSPTRIAEFFWIFRALHFNLDCFLSIQLRVQVILLTSMLECRFQHLTGFLLINIPCVPKSACWIISLWSVASYVAISTVLYYPAMYILPFPSTP